MSKIARIIFEKMLQDSQDYGSNDEHMVSRIFFTIDLEGQHYGDLYVDVKQTVGSSYNDGLIEVSSPKGNYKGPFNSGAFHHAVEKYYRNVIGPGVSGINIGPGARNIRMKNNTIRKQAVAEFEVSGADVSW